jgi:hypothetical protein
MLTILPGGEGIEVVCAADREHATSSDAPPGEKHFHRYILF